MNRKLLAGACALAVLTLAGCGSIPQGADRINIITEQEAKANNCRLLDKAGSVSAVMVNGYKRNTQVAVTKALRRIGEQSRLAQARVHHAGNAHQLQ